MSKKLSRISRVVVGATLALTTVAVSSVSAAKISKPGQAKIVRITSVSASKRKYRNVTFLVELPKNGGAPILETKVSGGGRSCTMKKSATTCTIKNVLEVAGYLYGASSRNKLGFGLSTLKVRFAAVQGNWTRTGYGSNGKPFPLYVKSTSNARVVSTQNVKWSKFQAIRRSTVASAAVHRPQVGPSDVVFQTSNAIGIALPATGSSGSGLLAVNRDGSVVDAVSNGTAPIQDFYSAPNNRVYVTFRTATALTNGATPCVLAEINPDSGLPTCIDTELSSIRMAYGNSTGNSPIQFDAAGDIYYLGAVNVINSTSRQVLRKYSNGSVTSLINDNISITDFIVMPNGATLLAGMTASTGAIWFRKLSPSGSISTLTSGNRISFMRKFADGNVYVGQNSSGPSSISRYFPDSGVMDSKPWLSGDTRVDSYFQTLSLCKDITKYQGFCSGAGSMLLALFNFGTERTLVVAGGSGIGGTLMQYYPTVETTNTILKNVTLAISVNNKLILAGTTAAGVNSLTVYDPFTYQETVVVDQSNEVEVYNLTYIASTNRIMFNGLRFSDNRFVLGEVEMP